MGVITPTVGRVVWFHPGRFDDLTAPEGQPLAAIVARVWGDRMVNLSVCDKDGEWHRRTSVPLRQPEDEADQNGNSYCEWMPYQIGQAKKHDAATEQAEPGNGA
jgi:hypothetical protein